MKRETLVCKDEGDTPRIFKEMKIRTVCLSILGAAVSLLLLIISVAYGYDAVDVKDGGRVKGVVRLTGDVPPDETVAINKDEEICGKEQHLHKYMVTDSGLKNAVVFIDNPGKGRPVPEGSAVGFTIRSCMVDPLVSVGFVGGRFLFRNEDPILHTLQLKLELGYQKKVSKRPLKDGATIYNIAFPKTGKEIERPIKRFHRYQQDTGFIRVTSNTHPWIKGYVFVFDHPYATVTDERGAFVIDNLPSGEYVLKTWHEGLGWQERSIRVSHHETSDIEIVYEKK